MSKDIKETKSVETKIERKKEIRRAPMEYSGTTYLDDKYKESGKVYRAVADRPGRIAYMKQMGYSIVTDENFQGGTETLNTAHRLGSAQTVELGKTVSQPGVWMEIDEDIYNARQQEKAKQNTAMFEQSVDDNRYDGQK
jgi:hypothetical protein